jgi:hypothetical protein
MRRIFILIVLVAKLTQASLCIANPVVGNKIMGPITKAIVKVTFSNTALSGLTNNAIGRAAISALFPQSVLQLDLMSNYFGTHWYDEEIRKYRIEFIGFRDWARFLKDILNPLTYDFGLADSLSTIIVDAVRIKPLIFEQEQPVCFMLVQVPKRTGGAFPCSISVNDHTENGSLAGLIYVFQHLKDGDTAVFFLNVGNICVTDKLHKVDLAKLVHERWQTSKTLQNLRIEPSEF